MNRVYAFNDAGNSFRQTDAPGAKTGGIFEFEGTQPTLTDGFGNKYWFIDTTGGNVAVALPPADEGVSKVYTVKRKTAGANTLTITPVSGNIDGSATHSIPAQYESHSYVSDGTDYWIIK
jgi:hypothetical protein